MNKSIDPNLCCGQGVLYVVSAPSGAGKTSLVKALLETTTGLAMSVSYTTRPKREGEQEAVDYLFRPAADFESMLAKNDFLEYACVFGNYYGTCASQVASQLAQGRDVILEIDWQGAEQVRKKVSDCVSIFILPPSRRCLQERLEGRGQDKPEVIAQRMAQAVDEMSHYAEFDYLIVNDNFEAALAQIRAIVQSRRLKLPRQKRQLQNLITELLS